MKYTKSQAKEYAFEHFRGVWAATATPFTADLKLDEAGFRANLRHWIGTLKLGGLFVSGKQGKLMLRLGLDQERLPFRAVEPQREEVGHDLRPQRIRHRFVPRLQHVHVVDPRPGVEQGNQLAEVRIAHGHTLQGGRLCAQRKEATGNILPPVFSAPVIAYPYPL